MALCSVAAEMQISTSFTGNKIGQIAYLETYFVEPKCKRISSGVGIIEFPGTLSFLFPSVSACLSFSKAVTCRNSVQNNLRVSELYARQQDQSRWCSFLILCKNEFWPNQKFLMDVYGITMIVREMWNCLCRMHGWEDTSPLAAALVIHY